MELDYVVGQPMDYSQFRLRVLLVGKVLEMQVIAYAYEPKRFLALSFNIRLKLMNLNNVLPAPIPCRVILLLSPPKLKMFSFVHLIANS